MPYYPGSSGGGGGTPGPMGPQGPAGPVGPMGATGLNPRGTWSAATAYVAKDVVYRAGSTWLAEGPSTGVTPGTNEAVWVPMAMMGQTGLQGPMGPQGATGAKGDKGDTGAAGADGLDAVQLHIGTTPPADTSRPWLDTSGS